MNEPAPFRLVSWNVENLVPWLAPDALPLLARLVEELGRPDVLCLQEVRVRSIDTALIERMTAAVPGYRCQASLCRDPENVSHRGGRAHGVATYARLDLDPVDPGALDWDREGRVALTRLAAVDLWVVNLYAVNGTAAPYYDHALARIEGDRHGFKRRLQNSLFDLARDLERSGAVVLAGDWNVSRTAADTHPRLRTEEPHARARAELNLHIARAGMVDVYRHLHPDARGYTWFNPRSRDRLDAARVDYALVSAALIPALRGAAILPLPPGYPRTDHVPVSVELAMRRRS